MKRGISKRAENKLLKLFKEYNVAGDIFDFRAEWDSSLTEQENFNHIKAHIQELAGSKNATEKIKADKKVNKESIRAEKEEQERIMLEQLQKEEEHTKKQFDKSLEKIKFETTAILDKAFYIPRKLIKTLIKSKNIHGLILRGEAGLGKTYTCLKVFKDIGLKKEIDYNILSSYSTPLELYKFLYENKDGKILLLDDIMKIFDNELNIGILLSALWGQGKRVVSYHTTSPKLTVPKSFIFNSKIIWCLNKLPQELENIKSRCYFYELNFAYKEKIMLLYELAKIKKIPLKIVDFIHQSSDEMTPNLDFRLLLKVYDIYQVNEDWGDIAKSLLKTNEKLALIKELLLTSAYVKEAVGKWQEETGLSRTQFYRYSALIKGKQRTLH